MSDPQPTRLKPKPRRAAPIQPDNPGRSLGTLADDTHAGERLGGNGSPGQKNVAHEKAKAQGDAALDNVREGYK